MATDEELRRLIREKRQAQFGTLSARPGFLERSLPAAGQITGGVVGARVGGVLGGILGATGGAVTGRLGQQAMRRARGEEISIPKAVGELGIEAGLTGAVETAFPVAGKLARPYVQPFLEQAAKKVVRPAVGNVLRFMGGIRTQDTERLLTRGPQTILSRPMRSREGGTRLAEDFLQNAQQSLKQVNQQWAAVTGPLRKDVTNVIPSQAIKQAAATVEAEFVGTSGAAIPGTRDVFREARRAIEGMRQLTAGASIPLDTAIRARQQLDDLIFTGRAQGLLAPRQAAALGQLRRAFKESIHQAFPQIAGVDKQRAILGEALEVVEKFSPESVTSVAKLSRMIDAFEAIDPVMRETLQKADAVIAQQTGKSLVDAIRDRSAAMAFEPTELRATRTWLIQIILGTLGFGAGGPGGATGATALGVTLSSPRLAGKAIKGAFAAGRGAKFLTRKAAPVAIAETGRQQFLRPQE